MAQVRYDDEHDTAVAVSTEEPPQHDAVADEPGDNRDLLISTAPARPRDRRVALAVVLVSTGVFLALIPFATVPVVRFDSFIPAYESALAITDFVTAILLFAQFGIVRSRALLVLACGYVFTALMTVPHVLSFPGAFAATGLFGAGPQTTAWLYMFWHSGFPIVVVLYALLKGDRRPETLPPAGLVLGTAALVAVLAAIAYRGGHSLPPVMVGNHYSSLGTVLLSSVWVLSLVAVSILWLRRPHSLLDLWLMVVLCAWVYDIALSAVFNAGRFDLGFYAGRVYGLMSASFVLVVLLAETT